MNQKYSILSIIVLIITIIVIPVVSFAGTEHNVTGFAWANMPNPNDEKQTTNGSCHPTAADYGKNHIGCGQGLGWISLNSTNQAGSVNYGVNLSENGTFTGNGWSPYGGWLNFNPTSGFPTGPSYSAKVDPTCLAGATACPVTGWIRFTAGGSTQSGGWDGWVKMSGNGYGVTVSAPNPAGVRTMTGYAWGDEVVGWIKFDAKIKDKDEIIPDICKNIPGSTSVPTSPITGVIIEQGNDGNCKPYACKDASSKDYVSQTTVTILGTVLTIEPRNTLCTDTPPPPVRGCTDPKATNYNPKATVNDGSCEYKILGCTDPKATNYNPKATVNDGSCKYECTYPNEEDPNGKCCLKASMTPEGYCPNNPKNPVIIED